MSKFKVKMWWYFILTDGIIFLNHIVPKPATEHLPIRNIKINYFGKKKSLYFLKVGLMYGCIYIYLYRYFCCLYKYYFDVLSKIGLVKHDKQQTPIQLKIYILILIYDRVFVHKKFRDSGFLQLNKWFSLQCQNYNFNFLLVLP